MLRHLRISNYTVLSRVEVAFQPGMNVITGETGAGKSLLLSAIGALAGGKRNNQPVKSGCDRAVVEAEFDPAQTDLLRSWLGQNDLPVDLPVILRREFHSSGRTRCFINDTPANQAQAAQICAILFELHGQHEIITFFDRTRQLALLDAYTNEPGLSADYQNVFKTLKQSREEYDRLKADIEASQQGNETLTRQLRELEDLDPQPDELNSIDAELSLLENAEKVYQVIADLRDRLNEAPHSIVEHLTDIRKMLPDLIQYHAVLGNWLEDLSSAQSMFMELNRSLADLADTAKHNPVRVEELRQRHLALTGFQKRWQCQDEELSDLADRLRSKIGDVSQQKETLAELSEQITANLKKLLELGRTLSQRRRSAAEKLADQVHDKLAGVGMPHARFRIDFEPAEENKPYPDGLDRVEYMLSPDGKIDYQPLNRVASGGEMSRIMLALKSSLAELDDVETLIFDEIDQGVSGVIARKVGQQLFDLARSRQVIVVTHLPQIASLGDEHLSVRIDKTDGAAVYPLNVEARIEELAALLTATGLSDGALLNAREMLESAHKLRTTS